eukprot:scaffold173049_cov20-Tisochrysis_lutea.AAC.3
MLPADCSHVPSPEAVRFKSASISRLNDEVLSILYVLPSLYHDTPSSSSHLPLCPVLAEWLLLLLPDCAPLLELEPLLAKSPKDRQSFVTSGALHRLQTIMAVRGLLKEPSVSHALSISSLFPEDVVKYYADTALSSGNLTLRKLKQVMAMGHQGLKKGKLEARMAQEEGVEWLLLGHWETILYGM